MASLKVEGLDDLTKELERMGELVGPLADAMLKAGAQPVVESWKAEATKRRHIDTGKMIKSISADRKIKDVEGASKYITVYPRGEDKGVRNAEKAFVLHYGSSKLDADHWVDAANLNAEPQAIAAMTGVFDHYVETGNVPVVTIKR